MPPISKPKSKLASKIKSIPQGPVWLGPQAEGWNGGVTQSMIGRWLCDRERFRLRNVLGLRTPEKFSARMEYGNMWHVCEEHHARGDVWHTQLDRYCHDLTAKSSPTDHAEIEKWRRTCERQFPCYVDHWSKHPDVEERMPLLSEEVFDVPYTLPSGRTVRLRGKWDSVDVVKSGENAGVWLQENKSKGSVDERDLRRQLRFDLQTMMYLTVLKQDTGIEALEDAKGWDGKKFKTPIRGVRYNVIRRPFSGGRGSIKMLEGTNGKQCSKCKGVGSYGGGGDAHVVKCEKCDGEGRVDRRLAETPDEFFNRLQKYFIEDPGYWFFRWNVEFGQREIAQFEEVCLRPVLEAMCDWYDCVTKCKKKSSFEYCKRHGALNYVFPFGVLNPITEGYETEYDTYVETGSTVGLYRTEEMFRELKT